MKNMQEMEAACCEKVGIEYCPERDDSTCLWNVSKKLRLIHPVCEDCPHHPASPELVEKLKAWLIEKNALYGIDSLYWRKSPYWICILRIVSGSGSVEAISHVSATANTEHEAFIKAFYAAFCKGVE